MEVYFCDLEEDGIRREKGKRKRAQSKVKGPCSRNQVRSGLGPCVASTAVRGGNLRLRIADSVNPLSNHAIFRIELEYGDGLVKWVIFRELKDFLNLHRQ